MQPARGGLMTCRQTAMHAAPPCIVSANSTHPTQRRCSVSSGLAVLGSQRSVLTGQRVGVRAMSCRQRVQRVAAPMVAAAAGAAEESDRPVKPAYNKYRSRADIEKSYLRQWQEVTARGSGGQERMTVFSAIAYLPLWAKYTLLPDFVRFLWWLVWVRACAVAHFFHRRAVKQGAKVDAWLAARGGQRHTFSRSVVLRRYHHNMGAWENLRYRWRLLRGQQDLGTELAALPQAA